VEKRIEKLHKKEVVINNWDVLKERHGPGAFEQHI